MGRFGSFFSAAIGALTGLFNRNQGKKSGFLGNRSTVPLRSPLAAIPNPVTGRGIDSLHNGYMVWPWFRLKLVRGYR
jgi:hypothetical protein